MNDDQNNSPIPPPGVRSSPIPAVNNDALTAKPSATPNTKTPLAPTSASPFKIIIPILMLVAVIFGVTFFAQYTPKKNDDDLRGDKGKSTAKAYPLVFGSGIRKWDPVLVLDPTMCNIQNFVFPGFYENGTKSSVSFWFENRNSSPVGMKVARTNCIGGRLAAIPPEVTDQLIMTSIVSGIPQGLVSALPLALAGPAANLRTDRLNWQEIEYRNVAQANYKVPAAPSTKQLYPFQWGILEMQFEVPCSNPGPGAEFILQIEGSDAFEAAKIGAYIEAVDPFNVSTNLINSGEWRESTEPRTYEVFVYSSTRGPHPAGSNKGDLPPPTANVNVPGGGGTPGPFVSVSQPSRLAESEFEAVRKSLPKAVRIESAYRYTITVRPIVGDTRADIGPLERDVVLELPESKVRKSIRVKGMVRGVAWLDNERTDIEIPTYRATEGIVQTIRIITEQRDTVLDVVREECSPKFVDIQLKKLPPASDRGYYELKVSIPRNNQTGAWNGSIVLELKGPRPQRMAIPIRGTGKL